MNMNISNKILINKNGNFGNLEKIYLKDYYTKIKKCKQQKYLKITNLILFSSRKEISAKVIIMVHLFQLLRIINSDMKVIC